MTPVEHAKEICKWFTDLAMTKYDKGQREHGGRLWRKPVWKLLKDEVIDIPIYFQVLEEQQLRIESCLLHALTLMNEDKNGDAKHYVRMAYNIMFYGNPEGIFEAGDDLENDSPAKPDHSVKAPEFDAVLGGEKQ